MKNLKNLKNLELNLKENLPIILIFLAFAALLLTPLILRASYNLHLPTGEETFLNLKIAKDFLKGGSNTPLEQKDVPTILYPAIIALITLMTHTSVETAAIILQLVLGMLSITLLFLILKNLQTEKNITLLLFLLSPITLYLFTITNKFALTFTLSLLCLYFFINEKYKQSNITLAIISFFGFISSISTLLFLILAKPSLKEKAILKSIVIAAVINLLVYISALFPLQIPTTSNFFSLFAETTSWGMTIFIFLLAIIGIAATWTNEKKQFIPIYTAFILLFFLALSNKSFIFFLNFPLICIASVGFNRLRKREWDARIIKRLFLSILIIGIISTFLIVLIKTSLLPPTEEEFKSLQWLKNNSKESEIILSSLQNSYFIQGIAERDTFIDPYKIRRNPELLEKSNEIFSSKNITALKEFFKNVKYVYITPQMKSTTWNRQDQGLLLILKYSKDFNLRYEKDGIEIWYKKKRWY